MSKQENTALFNVNSHDNNGDDNSVHDNATDNSIHDNPITTTDNSIHDNVTDNSVHDNPITTTDNSNSNNDNSHDHNNGNGNNGNDDKNASKVAEAQTIQQSNRLEFICDNGDLYSLDLTLTPVISVYSSTQIKNTLIISLKFLNAEIKFYSNKRDKNDRAVSNATFLSKSDFKRLVQTLNLNFNSFTTIE